MTAVPERVSNWLYSILTSEYRDVNRTYSDVLQTLAEYPTLSPRTEVYTFEHGSSALLLRLSGNLPVWFRGAMYKFPVLLWIPHAYPYESPIVYVTTSEGLAIRPGQYVSVEGRVYHPSLAQWSQYWDTSTLTYFLRILQGVFSKEPPIRSIPQDQRSTPAEAQAGPPPVPPPPREHDRQELSSHSVSRDSSKPPPPPPKPYQEQSNGTHTMSPSPHELTNGPPLPPVPPKPHIGSGEARRGNGHGYSTHDMPDHFGSGWPRGQYDSQQIRSPPIPPQPTGRPIQQAPPMPPFRPEAAPLSRYDQPPPLPRQQQQPLPPQSPQYQKYQGSATPQQYPTHPPPQQHYAPNQPSSQQIPYQQAPAPKQPEQIPDLLSNPLEVTLPSQHTSNAAIPAPPIPPNPEKDALLSALSQTLHTQLTQAVTQNRSAVSGLLAQQSALRAAHTTLQSELQQLQSLDSILASNERILQDGMRDADRVIEDAKTREVPGVDEVLVAPTVVGSQLWGLVAEEQGIAEAMYALGRGLDGGRVGADVFVRQTRALARERFLKKALIKKIARGMGLDVNS